MKPAQKKDFRRLRRKRRVRKHIVGTADRPRLTVFRSTNNIYAQIVDDDQGMTLVAASTMEKDLRARLGGARGNKSAAREVGTALASKAGQAGIKQVVFDRNGYAFHGRIKELAEAARKGGLEF
jgi:large subunit ribosomal protein L18